MRTPASPTRCQSERAGATTHVPAENMAVRALSSPARVEVLRALRRDGPQRVEELAERLGRHVNTVRGHLEILKESDLVSARPQEPDGPGRPPMLYAATVEAEHPYQILADTLAASLHQGVPIADRAQAWGRRLGAAARLEDDDLSEAIARLLRRMGFEACPAEASTDDDGSSGAASTAGHSQGEAPRAGTDASTSLRVSGCPFADTVAESGTVVCTVQEHLLRGAVEVLGGDPGAVSVHPDRDRGVCGVRLPAGRSGVADLSEPVRPVA